MLCRRRLFCHVSDLWEGRNPLALKVALIEATKNWETLTGERGPPCPVIFVTEDLCEAMKLDAKQRMKLWMDAGI